MALKKFIKENFVLLIGITLPVLLMFGFMLASSLPRALSDPPKYDLVFSVADYYSGTANNIPVSVRLLVKEGALVAQYTKNPDGNNYNYWKKLYIYEAATQKVRELPFGYPTDMNSIADMREDVVEALRDKKLSTVLQAPDGYELSYDGYSHSGLVNEIFWGGHNNEPRLRKGSSSVRLTTGDGRTSFYYNGVEFLGWVVP
jgi:hypothetical protein